MTNGDFAVYCARIAATAAAYCSNSLNEDIRDRRVERMSALRFLKDMHSLLEWYESQVERDAQ